MLVDTLEEAVRTSVARKYGEEMDIEVSYNDDTGDIEVYQFKIVVEEVEDPISEIDPRRCPRARPGRAHGRRAGLPPEHRGPGTHRGPVGQAGHHPAHARRRAGNHLRGIQGPRGRNRQRASSSAATRSGWIINLGRTEALLPKEEQIPRERYKRGDRVQAYPHRRAPRRPRTRRSSSRARTPTTWSPCSSARCPRWPTTSVSIIGVARDQGSRAKVAVSSATTATWTPWARAWASAARASRTWCRSCKWRAHRHRGLEPGRGHLRGERPLPGIHHPHHRG